MAKGKYHEWLTPDGLLLLQGWARDGLTDEQIADNMGIKRQTLYEWKKRYPVISDTLKEGKDIADRHVENSLYKVLVQKKSENKKSQFLPMELTFSETEGPRNSICPSLIMCMASIPLIYG